MGGVGNFKNFIKMGGANKLKWGGGIENSVIDPLQLERGEYIQIAFINNLIRMVMLTFCQLLLSTIWN